MKEAILLFSHGSVLCGAGENLRRIAEAMEARGDAPIVEPGYLNYSEPAFEEALSRCVERGASRILVTPYFLVAGKFVQVDLPKAIEKTLISFPGVEARLAEAMKQHHALADAILNCARRARPPAAWRDLWNNAPQFCRASRQCPLYGSARCPATSASVPLSQHAGTEALPHEPISECESLMPVGEVSPNREKRGGGPPCPQDTGATSGPRALLVMVHGSPRPESNIDMYAVVEEARARGEYEMVKVGFMECNEPSIPEAIDACAAEGVKSLVAVPYFLHTGNHVADDLPTLLEQAQEQHPDVAFSMGDYLGHDEAVMDVLRDRARAATLFGRG